MTPRILTVILTHLAPAAVQANLDWWEQLGTAPEDLLVAYGGKRENYEAVAHPNKCFVDDPRLRCQNNQRDKQSYSGVYRAITTWLREPGRLPYTHVLFYEFDQLPLLPDLGARALDALERERADLIGHWVYRIDDSGHPHYLYAAHDPAFHPYWQTITRRDKPEVVMSMLGTGSLWRREVFEEVSDLEEPFRVYLEIWAPTVAHHLGYRVRPYPDPAAHAYVHWMTFPPALVAQARQAGAWSIHPVKALWDLPPAEAALLAGRSPAPAALVSNGENLAGSR